VINAPSDGGPEDPPLHCCDVYNAEERLAPVASKTVDAPALVAMAMKRGVTTGSNCVPMPASSRRIASSSDRPLR